MSGTKLVDDWYMPENEKSTLVKLNSIRAAYNNPSYPLDDYQVELRNLAYKYLKTYDNVIDIGAHIGIFSVAFSKLFKHVYSFEINPDTYPSLELNINTRNISNVSIFKCGLGDKEELVKLTPTKTKSMGTSVVPGSVGSIVVKTLDSFEIECVSLIKIDVEGFEPFVLTGGINTIKKSRPVILMEDKQLSNQYVGAKLPTDILKDIGMIELLRLRKDVIYGWQK